MLSLQSFRNTDTFEKLFHQVKFNSLSVNPTMWSKTLKQFDGFCRQIVRSVFDHFVGLALKGSKLYHKRLRCGRIPVNFQKFCNSYIYETEVRSFL